MADEPKEKVEYTRPTSQVDAERRLQEDNKAPTLLTGVNPQPVTDEGFVGVDPIYQNAANEVDEPLAADEGADKLAEEAFTESVNTTEGSKPAEDVQTNYEGRKKQYGGEESSTPTASASSPEPTKSASSPTKKTAAPSSGGTQSS